MTKGSEREARRAERTRKTLEKYEGKLALIATYEKLNCDPDYVRRLKDNATKLRETLIVKGVIYPFEFDP